MIPSHTDGKGLTLLKASCVFYFSHYFFCMFFHHLSIQFAVAPPEPYQPPPPYRRVRKLPTSTVTPNNLTTGGTSAHSADVIKKNDVVFVCLQKKKKTLLQISDVPPQHEKCRWFDLLLNSTTARPAPKTENKRAHEVKNVSVSRFRRRQRTESCFWKEERLSGDLMVH